MFSLAQDFLTVLVDRRLIIYYLNLVNAKKTIVVSYFVVDLLAKLSHHLASSC